MSSSDDNEIADMISRSRSRERKAENERKRVTDRRPMSRTTVTRIRSRKQAHYLGEDVLHENIMKTYKAPILQIKWRVTECQAQNN